MPNCLSQKIPESKISTPPPKFLRSPPPLKIRSTPLPPPERSTRSFLDVGAFVEKERVSKPYKFGTVREAHARASVERERNKQGYVKCEAILALRSKEEEEKRDCLLSRFGQMILKIWCGSPFFFFFFPLVVYLQNTCYSYKC